MQCKHSHRYSDGHCSEITCLNYVGKCPKHAPSGRVTNKCSRED